MDLHVLANLTMGGYQYNESGLVEMHSVHRVRATLLSLLDYARNYLVTLLDKIYI